MSICDYVGKELLGWIYYNENYSHGEYSNSINRVCYVYPRFILSDGEVLPVNPEDFPQLGSFEVRIQGGFSSEEIVDKLTHLVSIRINFEPEVDTNQQNNFYRMKFNPSYGDESSEVWLERFKNDNFIQVINSEDSLETIIENRKLDYVLEKIYTDQIFIKARDGICGPFTYIINDNTVELAAVSEYDYNLFIDEDFILNKFIFKVGDRAENGVFLTCKNFLDENKDKLKLEDFISDEMLIETVLSVFEREENINSADVGALKKALLTSINNVTYPNASQERVERFRNIIKQSEMGTDFLFKIATFLLKDDKLKDYVIRLILDNNFEEIEDRLTIFIEVREKISELEREKDALQAEVNRLSIDAKDSRDFLLKENEDLAKELNEQIEAIEKELNIRQEELTMMGYVNDLATEKESLEGKIKENKAELENLKTIQSEVVSELKDSVDEYKNIGRVIAKDLRKEGMDDFMSTLKGLKNFERTEKKEFELASFNSSEELVNYVYYMMNFEFNYNISRNMVANLLVLFGMSYITNVNGSTGSGKTSMVSTFARALGLTEDNGLYIKVNIDPDIRSSRDLIGFYNPVSGELTANNKRLLEMMDKTCELNLPHIVLLDNANLSMPEHYLSSFLEHEIGSKDYLNLGGGKEIQLKDNMRFFTTLQKDHTSLELTSRFYDKTATVEAKYESKNFYQKDMDGMGPKGVVKLSDILDIQSKHDNLNPDLENKLANIINVFRRYGSPLSPRTIIKSRQFISSITPLLKTNITEFKYLALEMAVLQFMLPSRMATSINKRFIDGLLQEVKDMPKLEETLVAYKDMYDNFIEDISVSF
ncbi:hypothetical protein [uncultured Ezakiella sp.]|uniref:hypothetical protein n=1 Tax=uncultured Ezakiella sp. TaxID=1637529 RepID=UPI0025D050D4|nr:hypothetical protein [uncultured Ezakiella sp.]